MKSSFRRSSVQFSKGISLVEVVIAAAIFLTAIISIHAAFAAVIRSSLQNTEYIQAAFLAEEGIEAVKSMRDYGWDINIGSKTNGNTYRLTWSNDRWTLDANSALIDQKFDRRVVFSAVSRDTSGNIVTGGGTVDANSRKVTVTVSWSEAGTTVSKSIESYVSDVFSN